jgi:hypothetical protein
VQRIVGRLLSGKVNLSLMARSEYAAKAKQGQSKLGGEASVIIGSHPEFMMTIRSQCRQEECADMEDRSRALDPSAGSDHRWIEENLHIL